MSRLAAVAAFVIAGCSGGELISTEMPSCGQFATGHWDQRLVTPGASGTSPRVVSIQRMPDGSVIAGGGFDAMSGVGARNIARWDGTRWNALGNGLPGEVRSVAVDDRGEVWAVGEVSDFGGPIDLPGGEDGGGGSYVARWTGTEWMYVMQNVFSIAGITPVDGGIAIYGSFFQQFPTLPANGVAIWRDGVWSSTGLAAGSHNVRAATRTANGLCVTGDIQTPIESIGGVSCWNGSTWSRLGNHISGAQTIAQTKDGTWFVGGSFSLFDGGNTRYAIARLEDGQWRPLDGGVHPRAGASSPPIVSSISVDDDGIAVAGFFEGVGVPRQTAYHLARWSPANGWSVMTPPSDLFGGLSTVLAAGEHTYVGGGFARIGIQPGAGIAVIDGNEAHSLPEATLAVARVGAINDIIAMPDRVVMAGRFKENVGDPETAVKSLLEFDGEWRTIETDVPPDYSMTAVPLGDEGYAVRSGETLYRLLKGLPWMVVTDKAVDGPMVADGEGHLFFVVGMHPSARIVQTSRNDTSFYAVVPGNVNAMTIHEGALVIVTTNELLGGQMVYRRTDDDWQLIGAWSDYTNTIVSSPALGLVAATSGGTRIWNGTEWRTVSDATTFDMAACSDGIVAAIDEGGGSRLAFLDDPDGDWTYFGDPRRAQYWQILPTARGIYISNTFAGGSSAESPLGIARWALDDTGW